MNENTHYRLAVVIATLRAYLAVWFFVVALSLLAYIVEISSPMMGDINWQEAGQFGSSLFLSALGGSIALAGVSLSVIPLTLTLLLAVLLYFSLRHEGLASLSEYFACMATSAAVTVLAWLPSLPGAHLLPSLVGALVLSGIVAGIVWFNYARTEGGATDEPADVSRADEAERAKHVGSRERTRREEEPASDEAASTKPPRPENLNGRALLDFLRHGHSQDGILGAADEGDEPGEPHEEFDFAEGSDTSERAAQNVHRQTRSRETEPALREGVSIRGAANFLLEQARRGWYLVGPLLAALGLTLAVGVIVRIALSWSAIASLANYYAMSAFEHVGFALLQFFFAPTVLIYAAAYATGAGFALGSGITFSALGNHLGPLPAIPLLGALPEAGTRAVWMIAVIVALSVVIGIWRGWKLDLMPRLGAWGVAVVELFALASLAARLASGSLGNGALGFWGVEPLRFALLVILECGGGLAVGLFLFNPGTWKALRAGIARIRKAYEAKQVNVTPSKSDDDVSLEISHVSAGLADGENGETSQA